MRTTESVFEPRYHVALHNVGGPVEMALAGSGIELSPGEHWDTICMGTFSDVEEAIKEADRLHRKFLPIMEKHQQQKIDGTVFSWFSVEMELRPDFYTMVYWPGRAICIDEVKAAAANAWIATQNLKGATRH